MNDIDQFAKLIESTKRLVVIQADNPDGDSLASALALEEIFSQLGKHVWLYCGVDIPDYLKHLNGWDRVSKDLPAQFDMSIIVDTSAIVLLEKLEKSAYRSWVASKPVVVIDHHKDVVCDIPYVSLVLNNNEAVATGEAIYQLANMLKWPLSLAAKTYIASSILADSLGLSSEGTTPSTYRIMADLIEQGVDRQALEEARRALSKMPESIFRYKARLIERTELLVDGRLAFVAIPHNEIVEYSPLYNPAPLIQTDLLQIEGVLIAMVLKIYNDGKITGSIRTNHGGAIAAELAQAFGGGGHAYAAGFKITNNQPVDEVKSKLMTMTSQLLKQEHHDS